MPGVFEISVQTHFSAAHALRGYPGDCARLHGHNWIVRVFVRCRELDEVGIGIDFRVVKDHAKAVLERLDHCSLNEVPPFDRINPSSENIARYLYRELSLRLNSDAVTVAKIGVWETPSAGACYWEE
jgi:6-pyruvoyltetrahydropterin/6-carboxytetrahydropterin synthase